MWYESKWKPKMNWILCLQKKKAENSFNSEKGKYYAGYSKIKNLCHFAPEICKFKCYQYNKVKTK